MSPFFFFSSSADHLTLHSFPTRRSSDLDRLIISGAVDPTSRRDARAPLRWLLDRLDAEVAELPADRLTEIERGNARVRSEEHTSELQSQSNLVCRLLLEKKKKKK